jgi:hypothetical protein
MTNARAFKIGVLVSGIARKGDTPIAQETDQTRLGDIEQGPQEDDTSPLGNGCHTGEAVDAASPFEAHDEGLGLIVPRVPGDKTRDVVGAAMSGHQGVARLPRRGLQSGSRFLALPSKGRMRKAQPLSLISHEARFSGRLVPQPMINREYGNATWIATALTAPKGHKVKERHAVGAAGHGKSDPWKLLESTKPPS